MFRDWREVRDQFLEVQAVVDARGEQLRIEHFVYVPPLGTTKRDSDHYHKVARWVARLARLRFRCKVTAVKYSEYAGSAPSVKVVVSFI